MRNFIAALMVFLFTSVSASISVSAVIKESLSVGSNVTWRENGELVILDTLSNEGSLLIGKTGSIESYYVNNAKSSSIIDVNGLLDTQVIYNYGKFFVKNSCTNENLFENYENAYIEISGGSKYYISDFNNFGFVQVNKNGQLSSDAIESLGENASICNNGFIKSLWSIDINVNENSISYNKGTIDTYILNISGNGKSSVFDNSNGNIKCNSLALESTFLNGGKVYIENSSSDAADKYILTVYDSNINVDLLSVDAKYGDIEIENSNINIIESKINSNELVLDKTSLSLGRKYQEERTSFDNVFNGIKFNASKLITEGNIYTSRLTVNDNAEIISRGAVFVADSVDLQGAKLSIRSDLPLGEIDEKINFIDNKGISIFGFNFVNNNVNGYLSTSDNSVIIIGDVNRGKLLLNYVMSDGQIIWSNANQSSREISSLLVIPQPVTINNQITLSSHSMLVIDGSEAKSYAYFGNATGKNIVVEGNVKIYLSNVGKDKVGTRYVLSSSSDLYDSIPKGSFGKDEGNLIEASIKTYGDARYAYLISNIVSDDRLSFYTLEKGSTIIIKHSINARDLYPDVILNPLIEELRNSSGFDVDSENPVQRFISRAMDRRYLTDQEVRPVLNSASQIGAISFLERITTRINEELNNLVNHHLSMKDSMRESEIEAEKGNFTLWASPLYGHTHLYRGVLVDFGFGGLVLGGDFKSPNKVTVGGALHIGSGYGKSSGDYLNTKNNFTFWGISGYFSWQATNFFNIITATSYLCVDHKLKQSLPKSIGFSDIEADIRTEILTGRIRLESVIKTAWLNFMPYAGLRVHLLRRQEYEIKSKDATLFRADASQSTFINLPVGISLYKQLTTPSGWILSPMLDIKASFALGDIYSRTTIHTLGFKEVVGVEMQSMDSILFEGSLGLEAKKGDISLKANFLYGASQHERDYGVQLAFAWEF